LKDSFKVMAKKQQKTAELFTATDR